MEGNAEEFRAIPEDWRIPILLFRLEDDPAEEGRAHYRACRELLSPALRQLWAAYEGEKPWEPSMGEAYMALLSVALRYAGDEQLLRFAGLARHMEPKDRRHVADCLAEEERWQAALSVYAGIGEGDAMADAGFWCRAGVCLYRIGEHGLAREYLGRAVHIQGDCMEAKSYLQWIEGAEKHENIGLCHHKE